MTITEIFWNRVASSPDRPAILHKVDDEYRQVSWKEQGSIVERLQSALQSLGIEKEDKIAILSTNKPQWTWADLAILSCGAVTVPIYPTLSISDVAFLLEHSDSRALFINSRTQLEHLMIEYEKLLANLKLIVLMDDFSNISDLSLTMQSDVNSPKPPIFGWEELLEKGESFLQTDPDIVYERRNSVTNDDLATIVYTSGTTGAPKGVMIKHSNISSVLESMCQIFEFEEQDLALSFLPLSHVYERVGGQFLTLYAGIPLAFAESMETVAYNLQEVAPTIINAVPRFYEKAYSRVQNFIRQMPGPRQIFIRWAIGIGMRATKQRTENKIEPALLEKLFKTELRIAERLVFRKIRERFGGNLRFMTSGAAPLSNEVHIFFESIGIPIVEGYGLTETCAPLACNRPGKAKFKTVGLPLPGIDIKLATDGEILVRGPSVFTGYYKNEEATKEAFDGEWFKTGDIGEIDADGYLTITDRKKDIIITAGGKHVAPQFIESLYKNDPLISHILVYGDRRKYITALITLNPEGLEKLLSNNGIEFSNLCQSSQHPIVRAELEKLIQERNLKLAGYQRIKKFVILDREFSIEENDLTPTLKLRRKYVTSKYQHLLDGMYEFEDLEAQTTNSLLPPAN